MAMLTGAALDAELTAVVSRWWRLQYFRATPLAHWDDPLGRGRPIAPLRFNSRGGARVLYLGEDQHICLDEVGATGFPAGSWVHFPVEIHLVSVLNLTDPSVCSALGLTLADIKRNFRLINASGGLADTQLLGERCDALGLFDGILFPSAASPSGGVCMAVLERHLKSPAQVLVRKPLGPGGFPMWVPLPPGLASFPPTPAGQSPLWDVLP